MHTDRQCGRENGDNAGGSGGSAVGAGSCVSEAATAMHKRPSDGTSSSCKKLRANARDVHTGAAAKRAVSDQSKDFAAMMKTLEDLPERSKSIEQVLSASQTLLKDPSVPALIRMTKQWNVPQFKDHKLSKSEFFCLLKVFIETIDPTPPATLRAGVPGRGRGGAYGLH